MVWEYNMGQSLRVLVFLPLLAFFGYHRGISRWGLQQFELVGVIISRRVNETRATGLGSAVVVDDVEDWLLDVHDSMLY